MGDVTERDRQAPDETPALDTAALMTTMFETPGIIAGVLEDIGADYRYVLANRNACEAYGVAEGGLNGKTGQDLGMGAQHIADRLSLMRRCHERARAYTLEFAYAPPGRPSGWILGTYAPLPPTPGAGPRISFVVIDITARKQAEMEAAWQKERLSLALRATDLGLWEYDIERDQLTWDARTRELYGVGPDDPVTFASYSAGLHPADAPGQQAAYEAALRGENGGIYVREHRTVTPDGRVRWVEGAGKVVFEEGRAIRVLGTVRDIDDARRTREHQALLLAELNHRVKNSLATVQALAGHTLRSTPDPAEFRQAFESRLMSLAGAHDLLTLNAWETGDFAALVAKALEPFPKSAFRLAGSQVGIKVRPDLAVNLTLLIHELATNAAKYGALARPGGEVRLDWRAAADGLHLDWTETGGPPVTPPTRSGFGARLIRRSFVAIGGDVDLDYAPEGLRARFRAPLAAGVSVAGMA